MGVNIFVITKSLRAGINDSSTRILHMLVNAYNAAK